MPLDELFNGTKKIEEVDVDVEKEDKDGVKRKIKQKVLKAVEVKDQKEIKELQKKIETSIT